MYYRYSDRVNTADLKGRTFVSVQDNQDGEVVFTEADGTKYTMLHQQECCESVRIEDICGDLQDLVGSPLVEAEEESNSESTGDWGDTCTWTFYKFRTKKGAVTLRWYGTSNGYYSESVDIYKTEVDKP